jgi:5-methylthioadenosine/S-adenosylhomocysteine deaminase
VHVDTRELAFEPVGDPTDVLTHLVWSGGGRYVRDVWVDGRQVVSDGEHGRVNRAALREEVAEHAARLAQG